MKRINREILGITKKKMWIQIIYTQNIVTRVEDEDLKVTQNKNARTQEWGAS